MGYHTERGYMIAPSVFEVTVKESTDIAQLMLSGHLFLMDKKDLEKAKNGNFIYGARLNLENGIVISNKRCILPDELRDGEWFEYSWSREYECERDWS